MATSTNLTSLKTLAKSILNKLENNKYIVFNPRDRGELQEQLFNRLHKIILTDEDLSNQVRAHIAKVSDAITEQNITETDAFQSQKRALKARLGEHEVHGFYLQRTLRDVVSDVGKFLFDSEFVEDVFESDDAIHKLVMETIQNFDESKLS